MTMFFAGCGIVWKGLVTGGLAVFRAADTAGVPLDTGVAVAGGFCSVFIVCSVFGICSVLVLCATAFFGLFAPRSIVLAGSSLMSGLLKLLCICTFEFFSGA
jgi:hypothetical protein